MAEQPDETSNLADDLQQLANEVRAQSETLAAGITLDLESDEQLVKRLRGLGYIE